MSDAIPSGLEGALPIPDDLGKLSIVVAVARIDRAGNVRLLHKKWVGDIPSGGSGPEAFMLQARAHRLVSILGGEIEQHGWSTGRMQKGDPTSGEGSPL